MSLPLLPIIRTDTRSVSTHQANYTNILSLRATKAALDAQIRDSIVLLSETRKEVLDTASTAFPNNTNPVSYSELLTYARRISKFTHPRTRFEGEIQQIVVEGEGSATPKDIAQTNGSSVAATNGSHGEAHSAMEIDSATPAAGATQSQISRTTATALPAHLEEVFNSLAGIQFCPWPTDDFIRSGALASIQYLVNTGVDPATFDPEKTAELEAERKKAAEEEELQRELRLEEERKKEAERRMSAAGPSMAALAHRDEPKVFQLETFEDDEDEE